MKSIEDHGYILDIGLPGVSGFLPDEPEKNTRKERRRVGGLVNVTVDKLTEDGRTCIVTAEEQDFKSALVGRLLFSLPII